MIGTLVALSFIDFERMILPKRVLYPGLWATIALLIMAAALADTWHRLLEGAICAAAWFAFFFVLNLISPKILGFGDVRLAPLLGLSLGWFGPWYALVGFFASNFIGALVGVVLIAMKRVQRRDPVPYGVFLTMGTLLAIYAGPEIVSWIPATVR